MNKTLKEITDKVNESDNELAKILCNLIEQQEKYYESIIGLIDYNYTHNYLNYMKAKYGNDVGYFDTNDIVVKNEESEGNLKEVQLDIVYQNFIGKLSRNKYVGYYKVTEDFYCVVGKMLRPDKAEAKIHENSIIKIVGYVSGKVYFQELFSDHERYVIFYFLEDSSNNIRSKLALITK